MLVASHRLTRLHTHVLLQLIEARSAGLVGAVAEGSHNMSGNYVFALTQGRRHNVVRCAVPWSVQQSLRAVASWMIAAELPAMRQHGSYRIAVKWPQRLLRHRRCSSWHTWASESRCHSLSSRHLPRIRGYRRR